MRITDIHTHIFPDDVAAQAMPLLEEEAGVRASFDGTRAGLLGAMDLAGIDRAVVQPVATKPSQVRSINDWVAYQGSDRIVPFGGMHPDLDDPAAEMDRMLEYGLRGFKMHPEYQGFTPDEDRMIALLEAATEREMTVLFHSGIDIGLPSLRGTPAAFAKMLELVPGLTAILAHMGGFQMWDEVEESLAGTAVYLDTSYTLGHLPDERFLALVRAHGADRVLFGTDGPWTDMTHEVERIAGLGLDDDELEAIMGGNADELLGD